MSVVGKQVVVYSKANCPQCVKVKNELGLKAVDFTEVRVDQEPSMRDWLLAQGHRSVPIVYVDGVHVKDVSTITNEII